LLVFGNLFCLIQNKARNFIVFYVLAKQIAFTICLRPPGIACSYKISSLKLESSKDFKEFKRQANKKSKLWPIREYLEQYWDMILKVFPCFLLSPETVSEVFPLNEKMFDVVIFDEASQMYVENAIPTIFRGKQVVIAGDDK
jgi:hypothetical protein